MEFYVVYKLGDEGGKFGCTYFMSIEEARKYCSSWREEEPRSTILLDYECTED
jgi:hypothetical protein